MTRTPLPDFTGTTLVVSAHTPRWHGPGREYVHPGRVVILVHDRTWESLPETCTATDSAWFTRTGQSALPHDEGFALLCLGCGLDAT